MLRSADRFGRFERPQDSCEFHNEITRDSFRTERDAMKDMQVPTSGLCGTQTAGRLRGELAESIQTTAEDVAEGPDSGCAISVGPITPSTSGAA